MSFVFKPRYYQEDAVGSIFAYFASGALGNPIIAMPTGTGKSIVIADFLMKVFGWWPNQRVMMVTHSKELIQQNYEKLIAMWPGAPAGIYSSGLKRKESWFPITFAGIGSVGKKAELFGHVDLLLVDECHLISAKETTLYQKFIADLKKINPNLRVIGFTATPYRLGTGMLTDQLFDDHGNPKPQLFTDLCFDITSMEWFNRLLAEGFLSPLVPRRTATELKVDGVKMQGGEFVEKDLQKAVGSYDLTLACLRETIQLGEDRNRWLVFCAGVDHAILAGQILESLGISNVVIHSKLKPDERDERIAAYKSGKVRAAVNNNVLTTGFDDPMIDLIVLLRPTNSTVLWVQMLGRGTRPVYFPGFNLDTIQGRLDAMAAGPKQNCLVLDYARNTIRLGPINDPRIPKAKGRKGGGTAPVRVCEECGTYNHASARYCVHCGQEFPRELKVVTSSGTAELIKSEGFTPAFEVFKVDKVVYSKSQKPDRPPTIQASYFCGLRMFKSWVCLEHEGFASKKARDWWRQGSVGIEPPPTTDEALTRLSELREPTSIRVLINQKYPEVLEVFYA